MRTGRLSRLAPRAAPRAPRCGVSAPLREPPRRTRARAARSRPRALRSRRFSPRSGVRTTTRAARRSHRYPSSAVVSSDTLRTRTSGGTLGAAVVLDDEGLEDRLRVGAGDVLEVEPVAVDHLPVAQREDLHRSLVAVGREADDVGRSDGALVRGLSVCEVPDREEPVAVARSLLEALARPQLRACCPRAGPGCAACRRRGSRRRRRSSSG